ncbi:MAG: WipB 2 [Gammaproteobacteria bacterium]|jgi:hypothetical protein|nr:WipB 2 [Gammaproteobacteria bacterium]
MPGTMISEEANLNLYPQEKCEFPISPENQLTIGDLHGNALKLLHLLIRHHILDISCGHYQAIVNIYYKEPEDITRDELDIFNLIISAATVTPDAGMVRLIGDILADRGQNDYFTLIILKTVTQKGIRVEILLSNHDYEFIKNYENGQRFDQSEILKEQSTSMYNLHMLIKRYLVEREAVDDIVKTFYIPCLKAVSYGLNDDESCISIYSHAPIGLSTILDMATKLGIAYDDSTPAALASTIDQINLFVAKNKITTLFIKKESFILIDGEKYIRPKIDPFQVAIWSRNHAIDRPPLHPQHGYGLNFIHGHDGQGPDEMHIAKLEARNKLGRPCFENKAYYSIFISQNKIRPHSKAIKEAAKQDILAEEKSEGPIPYPLPAPTKRHSKFFQKSSSRLQKTKKSVIEKPKRAPRAGWGCNPLCGTTAQF